MTGGMNKCKREGGVPTTLTQSINASINYKVLLYKYNKTQHC